MGYGCIGHLQLNKKVYLLSLASCRGETVWWGDKEMGAVVLISLMFCSVVLLSWIWKLFCKIWLKPRELQRQLNEQGIYGHPYKLLYGNLKEIGRSRRQAQSQPINLNHKIVSRVLPFLHQTVKSYGMFPIFPSFFLSSFFLDFPLCVSTMLDAYK